MDLMSENTRSMRPPVPDAPRPARRRKRNAVPSRSRETAIQVSCGNRASTVAGNFIAVQMQNRQHRAVANRIQEPVGMPACGKRTGFRLAVANHARGDQVRIVKNRAERVQSE